MALHYDLTKIPVENRTITVDGEQEMSPVTHTLIWSTMAVGMTSITEKNWTDFYARLHAYELLSGAFLRNNDGPLLVTADQVRQHIGLSTNAGTETEAAWRKRILDYKLANFRREAENIVATHFDGPDCNCQHCA